MTHNKFFFSGRLEAVRQTPGGGNTEQEFVPEHVDGGPWEKDVLPLATTADPYGGQSYNLNPMLLESIRMSDMWWEAMPQYTKFSEVIDEIYYQVSYVTPWVPGTHGKKASGMQSAVRGVSTAGTPGMSYTFLLKLFIMKLTRPQIKSMLGHTDSPYIRALGFLYLRYAMTDGFKELFSWLSPYLGDQEEFTIDGTAATKTTIGDFVRRLLTDQDFFGDRLPRFPTLTARQIEADLKAWSENKVPGMAAPPPPPQQQLQPPPSQQQEQEQEQPWPSDDFGGAAREVGEEPQPRADERGPDRERERDRRPRSRSRSRSRDRSRERGGDRDEGREERKRERERERAAEHKRIAEQEAAEREAKEARKAERAAERERENAAAAAKLKGKEAKRKRKQEIAALEAQITSLRKAIVAKEDEEKAARA